MVARMTILYLSGSRIWTEHPGVIDAPGRIAEGVVTVSGSAKVGEPRGGDVVDQHSDFADEEALCVRDTQIESWGRLWQLTHCSAPYGAKLPILEQNGRPWLDGASWHPTP